jgi:hypothetical protein
MLVCTRARERPGAERCSCRLFAMPVCVASSVRSSSRDAPVVVVAFIDAQHASAVAQTCCDPAPTMVWLLCVVRFHVRTNRPYQMYTTVASTNANAAHVMIRFASWPCLYRDICALLSCASLAYIVWPSLTAFNTLESCSARQTPTHKWRSARVTSQRTA